MNADNSNANSEDSPYTVMLNKIDIMTKRLDELQSMNNELIKFNKSLMNRADSSSTDDNDKYVESCKTKLDTYLNGGK